MQSEILAIVGESPGRWTAAAIGWRLGRPPHGTLGQDPDPDLAETLTRMVSAGTLAMRARCPVCAEVGELYLAADHPDAAEGDAAGAVSWVDAREAIEPLVAEGLIEIGEIVEFHERVCCARTGRPWRRTPPPS